jgi:GDP-4-dehydro-6-deoxy-D-mannose reductase
MTSIITGSNGFIGTWLTHFLENKKDKTVEFSRQKGIDILNKNTLENKIKETNPDRIFHLAAKNIISESFANPQETLNTNIIGTLNLLEAIKKVNPKITFISVGSSSEYGSNSPQKLSENSPLFPNSPYALSKMTQYHLTRIYKEAYCLNIIHVRPFAIIGPLKKGDAISDFAKGIVQIERGEKDHLEIGDLSHARDFMDVRDAVSALDLISRKKKYDLYNICTGKAIALHDILDMLITMSKKPVRINKTPAKKRTLDDKIIAGDPTRLNEIGFKPKYSISDSLQNILEFWRSKDF